MALVAGLARAGVEVPYVGPLLVAVGGRMVIFGSCESMILCLEGVGRRMGWNSFVAGTMAGLAGNVPEVVMLGFVFAAQPRLGFLVVAMTLHVGAMAFGVYSGLLPRGVTGHAHLAEALVKLSTDRFAGAAGAYLATGLLMVTSRSFSAGDQRAKDSAPGTSSRSAGCSSRCRSSASSSS